VAAVEDPINSVGESFDFADIRFGSWRLQTTLRREAVDDFVFLFGFVIFAGLLFLDFFDSFCSKFNLSIKDGLVLEIILVISFELSVAWRYKVILIIKDSNCNRLLEGLADLLYVYCRRARQIVLFYKLCSLFDVVFRRGRLPIVLYTLGKSFWWNRIGIEIPVFFIEWILGFCMF